MQFTFISPALVTKSQRLKKKKRKNEKADCVWETASQSIKRLWEKLENAAQECVFVVIVVIFSASHSVTVNAETDMFR